MSPIQFFIGRVIPFRIVKKKQPPKQTWVEAADQCFIKELREEARRLAAYKLDREAKRIMNDRGY